MNKNLDKPFLAVRHLLDLFTFLPTCKYPIFLVDKLPDLLMFATGTTQIPSLGFHDPSKITVLQLDSMSGNLPNSNTCPQELELPRHKSYDDFKKSIDCALSNKSSGCGII